ncbi:MAG: 5'-methylthioadenosine/S-adenosylhomocysteine nucleosidase [Treponema sp.]|jgi:adenosylhomocysteine nucleosidase|nr:5'-methylthioadenosine/S-adenosylhomocysteine nucleosidase [Treponema sp.]
MIGIIGAMEEEVALLQSAMEHKKTGSAGVFEYSLGRLEGKETVLLRCGIGKVNAAVGCALMIARYNPEAVINTGSAGGIDPSLTIGDMVIASGLLYHDVDVTAFNYAPGQIPGQPQIFPVQEGLIRLAEAAMDELKKERILPGGMNHLRGLIGSGDVFMHQKERIQAVREFFPDLKAVEMESAAIAHACSLFKTPVIIIRALSDVAGAESPAASEEYLPLASKNSAELVRRIVRMFS